MHCVPEPNPTENVSDQKNQPPRQTSTPHLHNNLKPPTVGPNKGRSCTKPNTNYYKEQQVDGVTIFQKMNEDQEEDQVIIGRETSNDGEEKLIIMFRHETRHNWKTE